MYSEANRSPQLMYSAPAVTPVRAAAPQKNAVLYSVAGITCIGISLFLVVATIVVALIPIYTANRSTAVDASKYLTKEAVMYVPMDGLVARRRRQSNSTFLESYVGTEAGPNFRSKVAQTLYAKMDTSVVQEVLINSMLIQYQDDGRRKRWGLVKRANRQITLIIRFRIRFQRTQTQNQQSQATTNIVARINQTFSEKPILTNIDLYRNGALVATISSVQLSAPTFISAIIAAISSATIGSTPTTGRPTITVTNTTAAVVTTTTVSTVTTSSTSSTTSASVTPVMAG